MKSIKTLSLSIAEIKTLLSITDDADRRRALEYLTESVEHPDRVDPETVAAEHPAVQTFARRIHRRVVSAQKRKAAANRAKRNPDNTLSRPTLSESQAATYTQAATLTNPLTAPSTLTTVNLATARHYRKTLNHLGNVILDLVKILKRMRGDRPATSCQTELYMDRLYGTVRQYAAMVRICPCADNPSLCTLTM